MAQRKGQTGNPAGRPKGSKNRATKDLRSWINELLEVNRDLIRRDLKKLEPRDRLNIYEKLLQYAIPRLQSFSIEQQIAAEYEALEGLLKKSPDEAIERLTERVIRLNKLNNENHG